MRLAWIWWEAQCLYVRNTRKLFFSLRGNSRMRNCYRLRKQVSMPFKSRNCYLRLCCDCPNFDEREKLDEFFEQGQCEFSRWETTDRTGIRKVCEPVKAFKSRFKKASSDFVRHHFIMKEQEDYIRNKKLDLNEEALIVQVEWGSPSEFG